MPKKPASSRLNKTIAAWNELTDKNNDDRPTRFVVSRYSNDSPRRYDVQGLGSTNIFSRNMRGIKKRISDCRSAYENVGIIGNIIDIMTDFALEGLEITHESISAERAVKKWAEKINLYETVEEIFKCIFRDGNVPILTYKASIQDEEIKTLKKVLAKFEKSPSALFVDDNVAIDKSLPYKFVILNVTKLQVHSADIFGRAQYSYQFDQEKVDAAFKARDAESIELVKKLKEGLTSKELKHFKKTGVYPLKNGELTILHYKKDSYSEWANPMLWRVMDDLKFKRTLRNMDISIAESITNAIQIFRLGDVKEGLVPSQSKIEHFADMLLNPSKSKAIVWDNLVSIESDYPNTGQILGDEKYSAVNKDILYGIGISDVLIGGPGSNFSNAFLGVKPLLERLETGRQKVLRWINSLLSVVTKVLGFRKRPIVKFANMSLRDENAEKKMLLELVDRNMISYRTVLERFGEDFEVEVKRQKREDAIRAQMEEQYPQTMRKLGKFGPQAQEGNVSGEDMPSAQGPQGEKGGRPERTEDVPQEQEVVRDTKPTGASLKQIINDAHNAFKFIKKHEIDRIATAKCINKKLLTSKDKQLAEEIAFKILLTFSDLNNINSEEIDKSVFYKVEAPAKLERCVKEVFKKLVDRFREKNGRAPNAKEKSKLRSSAYAICSKSTE